MKRGLLILLLALLLLNIATSVNFREYKMKIKVVGDSMYPTLKNGEVVNCSASPVYQVGDIIVYQSGEDFVVHRIIGKFLGFYIIKGDHNNIVDPDLVTKNRILCKVSL